MDIRNLLSQTKAAQLAKCTRQNISRAIRDGELTPVPFDGRKLIPRAALTRWMKARRKPGWPKGRARTETL